MCHASFNAAVMRMHEACVLAHAIRRRPIVTQPTHRWHRGTALSRIEHAERRDREREALVAIGMSAVAPIARRTRVAALRAYRSGNSIAHAIDAELQHARPQIVKGMVAAHLQGRLRAAMTFKVAARDRLALSDPFRASLDFLERRLDLTPDQIVNLADRYSGDADTIVRALAGDVNETIGRAVTDIVQSGIHTGGGIARLREAFDTAGMGPRADWQLSTLYRTQVQTAYSAGQWNANQDPAIQEILWGYTYTTVGDDRVRPTHAAMDGTRAAKDDPLWETWFPPCGFNCRCTAIEIFNDDPQATQDVPTGLVHIDGVLVQPGPDKGWDFNPGELYRDALGLLGVN